MSEAETPSELSSYEKIMGELHHFLDVPMKISVQLARRNMKVRDILQLQPSSVVDLPKSAGENVDILINERIIGFGEVMELEGCTGIRLTDLNTLG
ncbi:MAG: FliM/FliN family flagellar motor switch protein [Acidobacteria bacterium]|nr:FliM/FliN family flagellar motor switch protein [Acidobacteriota bacterium]